MNTNCGGKKSLHASERDTPRVVALRQDFVETVAQHYDTRRFHFLDETGLRLDACRRYARAKGGQRSGQAVPLKRGPSLTLIGTLSAQGLGAVQLFEGALTYRGLARVRTENPAKPLAATKFALGRASSPLYKQDATLLRCYKDKDS